MQQLRNRFTVEWDDLSERGREDRRQEVFRHIIKQMAALLEATERHEEVKVEGKERLYRDAERCQRGVVIEMDAELRHCLVALWGNSEIQANFQQHHTEPACQTLEYFMQDAGLILEGGPITNPDLRRIPYSSVGLGSLLYTRNNVMFRICDGRKLITEEKKWLSMLDMEAVFYLVPLDDYDKGLEEDPTVNALEDTMARFSRILDLEHFRMTGVFLFFTNIVAFREKLLLTPIKAHDPANPQFDRWTDYTGLEGIAETDADARIAAEEGIQFFQNKFLAANQEAQRGEGVAYYWDESENVTLR